LKETIVKECEAAKEVRNEMPGRGAGIAESKRVIRDERTNVGARRLKKNKL
jgi:hypothetical protein